MSDKIRKIGIALLIAFAAFPLVTVLAVGDETYGGNVHESISEKAEKRAEEKTAEAGKTAKKADGKGAVQVITPARSGMCRLARVMSVVSLISFVLYFVTTRHSLHVRGFCRLCLLFLQCFRYKKRELSSRSLFSLFRKK